MSSPQQYADTLNQLAAMIRRKPMTARAIAEELGCCKPVVYQRLRELARRGRTVTAQPAPELPRGERCSGPRAVVYSCR